MAVYNVFELWGLLLVHFDSLAPPEVRIVNRCTVSEGCYYYGEQHLGNLHIWRASWPNSIMHAEQTDTKFIMHAEQTATEYGEGAPAHISAASARRRGPTLAIKLPSCCEVARRRDSERADPRQLCQLRWRSAKAVGIIYFYSIAKVSLAMRQHTLFSVNSSWQHFTNSTLGATHLLELFELEFAEFDLFVGIECTVIHGCVLKLSSQSIFLRISWQQT